MVVTVAVSKNMNKFKRKQETYRSLSYLETCSRTEGLKIESSGMQLPDFIAFYKYLKQAMNMWDTLSNH